MHVDDARQRLAAILAADAVGYSRLMEADEAATARALESAHAIFRAHVDAHRGRVVNTVGDSVLAVFDTASGAVVAATEVQGVLEGSGDVPDERRLRFRIGVHLGEVSERADGDVYGDGVNIAARLQALAAPGSVVVSEAVRGAVKNRVPVTFVDLGAQAVKNIAEPVRAYAVRIRGAPDAARAAIGTQRRRLVRWGGVAGLLIVAAAAAWLLRAPMQSESASSGSGPSSAPAVAPGATVSTRVVPTGTKPSIAILPFENLSGEADKAYFADGMTEDLITDLSKVDGLVVIARNSSFQYRGRAKDVREIGRALNARFVLEGSIRRSGDRVRVNAQLIDAGSGTHVWADRYDGELKNVFALQDTIARSVVKALAVEITGSDNARFAKRTTDSVPAYDALLKGWEHYRRQTPEAFKAAIGDFKKAAEIDPGYSRAWAALAAVHWEAYTRFWGDAIGASRHVQYDAEQYLQKAMRDPTPLAHQVASAMMLRNQRHLDALAAAQRAVAADPNDAEGYIALSAALTFAGRPAEALEPVEKAMRLNPHYPSSYPYHRGLALFGLNRLDEAQASLERALELNPDDYWSQRLLIAIYGLQGRREHAARIVQSISRQERRGLYASYDPLTIRAVTYWYPFARPEDAKRFASGLAKAGVPD